MGDWNLVGQWDINQGNDHSVTIDVKQESFGGGFFATATQNGAGVQGTGSGSLQNNHFFIRVDWSNKTSGVYCGIFDPRGALSGATFDANNVQSVTWWRSSKTFSIR
jgi:hypothetical protein